MVILIKIINLVFEILFYPFKNLPPIWGLIVISIITGIVMLIIFRYTSNQKEIKKAKDKIKAHIFELVLYKDSLRVILKAFKNILKYNVAYLKQTLIALVFVIIPVIIILIQFNFRYEYRSFKSNESFLVKLKLNKHLNEVQHVKLTVSNNLKIGSQVLRIPENNEYDWRIKIEKSGIHELMFEIGEMEEKKIIDAKQRLAMLSPVKVGHNFFKLLFNPGEVPLAKDSIVESINIRYPHRQLDIYGLHVHWLVVFFVISLIAAFGLKGIFRVEI